jgi:hypothetical protein
VYNNFNAKLMKLIQQKRMRTLKIIVMALCIPFATQAQLVIGSTAVLAASGNPDIKIQSIGGITNNTTFDFSTTNLRIDLSGTAQSITGNFVLAALELNGDGVKTLNGNLTVTNQIKFGQGILKVSDTGKILFTGSPDGIVLTELNNTSYVDGIFHNAGGAPKKFPIGTNNLYAPAILPGSTPDEVGMRVNTGSSQLVIDKVELIKIDVDRYWEITTGLDKIDSRVVLSLNGLDSFIDADDEGSTAVAQGLTTGASAKNLGSNSESDDGNILSSSKVSAPILAIAKEINVVLKIHDLITPFGSPGTNDKLMIQNLDRFDFNTVTLLDRWGVQVAVWKDYKNDTTNYDFSKLGPGNYICIVQYGKNGGEIKVEQQMVTVIKTN